MLPTESLKLEINVPARMRDGVILYADIWRPDTEDKYPAILTRLPYRKGAHMMKPGYMNPQRIARTGYAVVIQDCRGTGESEGEHYHFRSEPEDGYDTVEWVSAQTWCDGNVGMYGPSYLGGTQWLAAVTQPPHLKAICPAEAAATIRGLPTCKDGVFNLQGSIVHTLRSSADDIRRSKLAAEKKKALLGRLVHILDNIEEQYLFLPLKDVPAIKMLQEIGVANFYEDWLTHLADDEYWGQLLSPVPIEKVAVPAFHMSGWSDFMASGVLKNFNAMKERAGSEQSRKNQKLLMGPWGHGVDLLSSGGELDFGIGSSGDAADVTGMHIRWFDYWLKGIDNGIMDEPPVRIFVMGDNVWRDENEWPLARAEYTNYYFHSRGRANSLFGDGILSVDIPCEEEPDIYLYDPRNPVPTKWGVSGLNTYASDIQDQQGIEERADILVYTTTLLAKDLEVTGPIEIKLFASSSAVDTDFTGKLVDVWPNGKAYNLVEGIVRARHRESGSEAKLIEPGKIYEYSIDLRDTSNVFKAGHRIRIEISSSNFPKYDRNLNTGHPIGQDAEMKIAVQTIYHDKRLRSHVLLPVIPRLCQK